MATKIVKIAEICIGGKVIDIEGEVRQEALVFEKHYNEGQTQDIIDRIMKKEIPVTRKLDRRGYIFNDDLEMISIETEVVQFLLEYCFKRKIGYGQELGQQGRAIYYDENYVRRDGKKIKCMAEELYNEHYGIE